MKKVLYFEGAGWSEADTSKATIGNCRVRTAFQNNEGRKIYLELGACALRKGEINYKGMVDYCFYIDTESKDPCNECRIINVENKMDFLYSKEDITRMINKTLNCNFDTIEVLHDLSGYRVHGENRSYNMIENYEHNPQLIEKRKTIKEYFSNIEKSEGKKYPNFSLWVDDNNCNILHLLRHFNGYNKHWIIKTDMENWKDSIEETKLNQYGC